jgi:hypothetical protein
MSAIINPRKLPKNKPNNRSTMLKGVARTNIRTSLANSAQTINTATKVTTKVAEEFSALPATPMGTCEAMEGDNQYAMKYATTQPARDINSNTKPRQSPTSAEIPTMETIIQSTQTIGAFFAAVAQTNGSHSVNTTAERPAAFKRSKTLSACSLDSMGPIRTRVRLPEEVSTTWV